MACLTEVASVSTAVDNYLRPPLNTAVHRVVGWREDLRISTHAAPDGDCDRLTPSPLSESITTIMSCVIRDHRLKMILIQSSLYS